MDLLSIYQSLQVPPDAENRVMNAQTIPGYPHAKVAVNGLGLPVILIKANQPGTAIRQKNLRLKYIELAHRVRCTVTEGGQSQSDLFSLIHFRHTDPNLLHSFFSITASLIRDLSHNPAPQEVAQRFNRFAEVFRVLSSGPATTVQGLWAELLVIHESSEPDTLIHYWHNAPTERFDFNAGDQKIEVKSSARQERIHTFSDQQLHPPEGQTILIASVFTRPLATGYSLAQLMRAIEKQLRHTAAVEKLHHLVLQTLGNNTETGLHLKYDLPLAQNSLRFYPHSDISRIERANIPRRVSEVCYKSDLSGLTPVDVGEMTGLLFGGI